MNMRQISLTVLIAAAMGFASVSFAQETPPTSDQASQENQQMEQQQQTEPLGMCARFALTASPPLRPASRASSDENS